MAYIATKALNSSRLLSLLDLVNVRLPGEGETGPVAAKFFGRLCPISAKSASELSPATLLALALISQPRSVEAAPRVSALTVGVGMTSVAAQPVVEMWDVWSLFQVLLTCFVGLVVVLVFLWMGSLSMSMASGRERLVDWRGISVEASSPRSRREAASSSHEVVPSASAEPSPVRSPQETVRSRWNRRAVASEGGCVFPMVGRIDYRANWVPSHFMRYLLSAVGPWLVEALGTRSWEVWLLREVARTFRYGVASAYEGAVSRGASQAIRGGQGIQLGEAEINEGPEEGSVGEDLQIDEVRHLDPNEDLGPYPEEVNLQHHSDADDLISTDEESSTSASGEGPLHTSDGSELEEPGEPSHTTTGPPDFVEVRYRAEDGALIVVHAEEELRVPLLGWSLEEVFGIVRSIQEGDWSFFHEVLALQGSSEIEVQTQPLANDSPMRMVPPNGVFIGHVGTSVQEGELSEDDASSYPEGVLSAMGSEEGWDLPPLEDLAESDVPPMPWEVEWAPTVISSFVDQIGLVWWVIGVFCSSWGLWDLLSRMLNGDLSLLCGLPASDESPKGAIDVEGQSMQPMQLASEELHLGRVFAVFWFLSAVHRVGIVLLGLVRNPSCVLLELPGFSIPAVVPYLGSPRWVVWIMLIVLFGLAHPAESQNVGFVRLPFEEDTRTQVIEVTRQLEYDDCPAPNALADEKDDRSVVLIVFAVATISVWETFKWVLRQGRAGRKTAESQTEGMNIVPLPLASGVPFRSKILFSLWRAGYSIDMEPYPATVQEEFHSMVGAYLRRLESGTDSSE